MSNYRFSLVYVTIAFVVPSSVSHSTLTESSRFDAKLVLNASSLCMPNCTGELSREHMQSLLFLKERYTHYL